MSEGESLYELSALTQRQAEILENLADLSSQRHVPSVHMGSSEDERDRRIEALGLRVSALDYVLDFTAVGVAGLATALNSVIEKLDHAGELDEMKKLVQRISSSIDDLHEHRDQVYKIADDLEKGK